MAGEGVAVEFGELWRLEVEEASGLRQRIRGVG